MKKIIFLSVLTIGVKTSFAQLKVATNGAVGVGINNPIHSFHAWGYDQCFNYNSKEVLITPNVWSGNTNHSMLGSNLGNIVFWHNAWGYNTLTRGSCVSNSDSRIKRDITPINNSLSIIKQLQPKKYKYIDSIIPGGKYHYGFIAQEVREKIPEIVEESGKFGFLTLNYEEIIPFLTGAIKEQSQTIDSLRNLINSNQVNRTSENSTTDIKKLENQIVELQNKLNYFENSCCSNLNIQLPQNTNNTETNSIKTEEEFLFQNVPNPFQNTTTIKFSIPKKINGNFFIKIYKISGEELMSFSIKKEDTQIEIDASRLVNGVYNYGLVANNELIKMKQMIINR